MALRLVSVLFGVVGKSARADLLSFAAHHLRDIPTAFATWRMSLQKLDRNTFRIALAALRKSTSQAPGDVSVVAVGVGAFGPAGDVTQRIKDTIQLQTSSPGSARKLWF